MQTITQVVAAASRNGIAVVPVREDGSKRPDLASWAEYQTRKPTNAELRAWFGGSAAANDRTGVGWIMGAVSGGMEALDFDDGAALAEYVALGASLGVAAVAALLEHYHERTPHGAHLFWRCESIDGNQKLARSESGGVRIETRGEGGFVVVAPSHGAVHPTGEPYVAARDFEAGGILVLTVEERAAVLDLARTLDRGPRSVEETSHAASTDASGTRPGDIFNGRATWADVLTGWKRIGRHGSEEYWSRPGARTGGVDATTNYADSGLLYVFSTSAVPFEPERGYSLFAAEAQLRHGGDYGACARALAAQGYTVDVEPSTDFGSAIRLTAGAGGKAPAQAPASALWRSPTYRFDHGWPPASFVARYIAWASGQTDAPHEYHEAAALTLLAAVTPNVRAFLPSWRPLGLSTALYFILVGGTASARKTTVLSKARSLIRQVEPSTILAERMTPEALIEQLAGRSRRGSLMIGDEFGEALDQILNGHSYMSAMRELLLSLYSERHYRYVRRSKRDKGGELKADEDEVTDPHFSLLTASTGAIFEVLTSRDVQTGFLGRFGIVYPEQAPPRRSIMYESEDDAVEQAWLVEHLAGLFRWSAIAAMSGEDIVVQWDDESGDLIDEASTRVENSPQEIVQRLGSIAMKVAMLSALGEQVPAVQRAVVEVQDVKIGIRVMERLEDGALRFADQIGGLSAEQRKNEQAMERVRRLIRESNGSALRSAIGRALKVSARQLDDLEATMADRGIIRVSQDAADGPGRPAKVWRLA